MANNRVTTATQERYYPEQEIGNEYDRIYRKEDYATCKLCGRVIYKSDEGFAVINGETYCLWNGCAEKVVVK